MVADSILYEEQNGRKIRQSWAQVQAVMTKSITSQMTTIAYSWTVLSSLASQDINTDWYILQLQNGFQFSTIC